MIFEDEDGYRHFLPIGDANPENLEDRLEYFRDLWQQDFSLLLSFRQIVLDMVKLLPDTWINDHEDTYNSMMDAFEIFNITHPISHPDHIDLVKDMNGEWVDIKDFILNILDK